MGETINHGLVLMRKSEQTLRACHVVDHLISRTNLTLSSTVAFCIMNVQKIKYGAVIFFYQIIHFHAHTRHSRR